MGINQSKNSAQNYSQNEKEEDNVIIIKLKISDEDIKKEINILCDKNKLIQDIKRKEDYYKENNIVFQKNLIILIKIILNYI